MKDIYKSTNTMTIAPGCPWHEAQQKFGPPNINWCEESQCSIIDEPANTWSNIAFFIAAYIIIRKVKNAIGRHFGYIIFVMGLFSFIYHATNNYFSQFFDYVGMYLMVSYLMAFNVTRFFNKKESFYSWFWAFSFFNLLIFLIFDFLKLPVQLTIVLAVLTIVPLDLLSGFREKSLKKYSYFALAIVSLCLSQTSAMIDLKRIYCNPDNIWLHGHVFWHIFNAIAMAFIALHMNKVSRSSD